MHEDYSPPSDFGEMTESEEAIHNARIAMLFLFTVFGSVATISYLIYKAVFGD